MKTKAVYHSGRSAAEPVFTTKTFTEMTFGPESYDIFLLLLDISNASDTENYQKLMEMIESVLTNCKLRIFYLLINDIILNVGI